MGIGIAGIDGVDVAVGNGVGVGVSTIAATAAESGLATVGVGVTTPAVLETVLIGMGIGVTPALPAVKLQPDSNQNRLTTRQVVFNDTESMSKVVY